LTTDNLQRLENARRKATIVIVIVGLLFLAFVAVCVLLLLPFRPMTIYSYTSDTKEVCPNELVELSVDYEIQADQHIESMDLKAGWEEVYEDGTPRGNKIFLVESEITAPDEYFDVGRHYGRTRAPRLTPNQGGYFMPTSEVDIHGWQYGVPNTQHIVGTQEPSSIVRVKPIGEC
jgi:hypothetical protein